MDCSSHKRPLETRAISLPSPDPAYHFLANVLWRISPLSTLGVVAVTVDRVEASRNILD